MATTPGTHSRTSSASSAASSGSSSPTYRLFPRAPKPSSRSQQTPFPRHHLMKPAQPQLQPQQEHQQLQPQQPNQPPHISFNTYHNPNNRFHNRSRRRHSTTTLPSPTQLTTSIERATFPMLANLNHQLNLAHLEPERDRVRRQIQRQETVLTLSTLLKGWGDQGIGEESSRWSDDSDDDGNDDDDDDWQG